MYVTDAVAQVAPTKIASGAAMAMRRRRVIMAIPREAERHAASLERYHGLGSGVYASSAA